jgi:hypothetical protein
MKNPFRRDSRSHATQVDPEALRRALIDLGWLAISVTLVVWLTLWMRVSVGEVTGYQNEDVAGITYNADLLLNGHVPLKDNLEYKAPGSFFLTAFIFSVFERSVPMHEQFGVFWSVLAALGMLVGGRLMFGRGAGLIAGLLYAYFSPITDSMTVNYNSWMIAPYIWATVLLAVGLKRGGKSKKELLWLVLAGFLAVIAALMKRQGAVIVPAFGLVLLIRPSLESPCGWQPPGRWQGVFAFSAGVLLGFLPISLYYLFNSGFSDFVSSYFGSGAGWDYVKGQEVAIEGKIDRLEDGLLGLYKYMALPMLLATISVGSLVISRHRKTGLLSTLLGLHLLMSFVGAALGFRFFKGYYLQLLPAAAWLAAHSEGPLMRLLRGATWPKSPDAQLGRTLRLLALALLCLPTLVPALTINKVQSRRRPLQNRYQLEAKRIAQTIKKNTKPSERIWVWGRWAWPVYFYADRLSVTRYYKVLGLITTNLTNTWRRPTSMTRFVKKGPWKEIGSHLAKRKPVFIVAAKNESYRGFTPLEKLLREHYRLVTFLRVRDFDVYVRKDKKIKDEPPAKKRAAPPRHPRGRGRYPAFKGFRKAGPRAKAGVRLTHPAKPKGAKPKGAKPKGAKPKGVKPKAAKPKGAKPKAVKPKAAKPKAVKPKAVKPKARRKTWPRRKATKAVKPKAREPKQPPKVK